MHHGMNITKLFRKRINYIFVNFPNILFETRCDSYTGYGRLVCMFITVSGRLRI